MLLAGSTGSKVCAFTGLADLSEKSVRSFEQQASTAAIQLKQAAQAGNHVQFGEAVHGAQCFAHLSGLGSATVWLTALLTSYAVNVYQVASGW